MEIDISLQQELIKAIAAFNGDSNWYESSAAIAMASGIVAILGALIAQAFNIYSEKIRQAANIQLTKVEAAIRKQEKIQADQVKALQALSIISHELQPTIWSHPEYDSDDAYSAVVFSMGGLLDKLDDFLKRYSYIMPSEIIGQVNFAMFRCNTEHWGASTAQTPEYEPSPREIEAAQAVLRYLNDAVVKFKEILGITTA